MSVQGSLMSTGNCFGTGFVAAAGDTPLRLPGFMLVGSLRQSPTPPAYAGHGSYTLNGTAAAGAAC